MLYAKPIALLTKALACLSLTQLIKKVFQAESSFCFDQSRVIPTFHIFSNLLISWHMAAESRLNMRLSSLE